MLGLPDSGKTTILHQMTYGKVETTIPTIGMRLETVTVATHHKLVGVSSFTVGGRDILRPLLRFFYRNTTALIWVLDATPADDDQLEIVRDEFMRAVQEEEMKGHPVLVFLNKIDLPKAMSTDAAANKLGLHSMRDRKWFIQPCCALTKDGIFEGLNWLLKACADSQSKAIEVQANTLISMSKLSVAEKAAAVASKPNENYAASSADTESTADVESSAETEVSGC